MCSAEFPFKRYLCARPPPFLLRGERLSNCNYLFPKQLLLRCTRLCPWHCNRICSVHGERLYGGYLLQIVGPLVATLSAAFPYITTGDSLQIQFSCFCSWCNYVSTSWGHSTILICLPCYAYCWKLLAINFVLVYAVYTHCRAPCRGLVLIQCTFFRQL